jgi:hypothetical protein
MKDTTMPAVVHPGRIHYKSVDEWRKAGQELFGKDMRNWKFVCPVCGMVQDYWDYNTGLLPERTAKDHVYLSCLSKFRDKPGTLLLQHRPICGYDGAGRENLGHTITIEQNGITGTLPVLPFYIAE